jgi:excisionase family DNA binding protein
MVKPKPVIEPNAVYSREEAAEILGVSLSTVKRMIAEGHLQVSRLNGGRRLFIRGANILAMLDQATVQNQTLAGEGSKRALKK